MTSSTSGLGTSGQTLNTKTTGTSSSATAPYANSTPLLDSILSQASYLSDSTGTGAGLTKDEEKNYGNAQGALDALPTDFGKKEADYAQKTIDTKGDPTGILGTQVKSATPIALADLDPTKTPGLSNSLKTIRDDVTNSTNSQFAGAGRSLSGLNSQALARGIAYGESTPLLNQYNSNVTNALNADTSLGTAEAAYGTNLKNAFTQAADAPKLATSVPLAKQALTTSERRLPYTYLSDLENITTPISGLGGTTEGGTTSKSTGSGTTSKSLLDDIAEGLGLLGPTAKAVSTVL